MLQTFATLYGASQLEKTKTYKCLQCKRNFLSNTRRKKFCKPACRWLAWYYRRHDTIGKASPCVYCGLPATTIDHVPPQSVRPFLESVGETRFAFLEVPACRECNCAIGAKTLWTIAARKEYCKRYIERKYRRILSIPGWSDDEIRDLGPGLELHVAQGLALRNQTRRRLQW